MNQSKQVILIPHWISETLKRHQKPTEAVLDFALLREIVSLNDLAGMEILNTLGDRLGLAEHSAWPLADAWTRGYHEGHALNKYYFETVVPFSEVPSTKTDLIDRLFSIDARNDRYEKPFIIYDMAPNHIGVVIYPGFFTGEDGNCAEHQFSLLEELVKALYVYAPLHEVAATSVFHTYLGLLSKKRIMV